MKAEGALALLGYPQAGARALRRFGLVALGVGPEWQGLPEVLAACQTLGFAGALIHPDLQESAAPHLQLDPDARRAGLADAVSFTGAAHATYAAPEALLSAVQESAYASLGAHAVLIGQGSDLRLGLGLSRLGFKAITVVAGSRSDAEKASRDLPAGLAAFALARNDPAVQGLAERADLLVLTGGALPSTLAQPYHTVLDLTGKAGPCVQAAGATLLSLPDFPARVLSRQLEYATGQKFRPDALEALAAELSKAT